MGSSLSSIGPDKTKIIITVTVTVIIIVIVIVIIILGALGGSGMFNTQHTDGPTINPTINPTVNPTVNPTIPLSPVGTLALFSPTTDGKTWTKVFDSMMLPNKCFLDLSRMYQLSPANLKKITKYQIDNNMLPIDNPFKNVIDVPVIDCSSDSTKLILTLDLTKYDGVNPFKQGDELYIFGINGETTANTVIDSTTHMITQPRYVYAVLKNQITISSENPCNYQGICTSDNSFVLFSSGTYTNGGTVRFVGNSTTGTGYIQQRPQLMFYLYMGYKNYQYKWPFEPITAAQAYSAYSSYYNGFKQWFANIPPTCTQSTYVDNSTAGFVSGSVSISGGSGTGLQMYIISMKITGYELGVLITTNDGTGYKDEDQITVTQGSATTTVTISVGANCEMQSGIANQLYLSYTTTQQQLKNLLDYAMTLDSNVNTLVFSSNTTYTAPDNYNNPNIVLTFGKTTPDSTFSSYATKICSCNGQQDQGSPWIFFPNKISQCADQIIYTSDTFTVPFDFINNAGEQNCKVEEC